jgi:hypothetical protein
MGTYNHPPDKSGTAANAEPFHEKTRTSLRFGLSARESKAEASHRVRPRKVKAGCWIEVTGVTCVCVAGTFKTVCGAEEAGSCAALFTA